jgi:hypothetical protein
MTQIIITISPDPDGVHCGECDEREFVNDCALNAHYCCRQYFEAAENCTVRGPSCLAAEKLLKDLVAAGDAMASRIEGTRDGMTIPPDVKAWDAAITAVLRQIDR